MVSCLVTADLYIQLILVESDQTMDGITDSKEEENQTTEQRDSQATVIL